MTTETLSRLLTEAGECIADMASDIALRLSTEASAEEITPEDRRSYAEALVQYSRSIAGIALVLTLEKDDDDSPPEEAA